jgi:hypothetical protein
MSPNVEADTIIPAVKATRTSFHFSDNLFTNKIGNAPRTVAIADTKLPISADSKLSTPLVQVRIDQHMLIQKVLVLLYSFSERYADHKRPPIGMMHTLRRSLSNMK